MGSQAVEGAGNGENEVGGEGVRNASDFGSVIVRGAVFNEIMALRPAD